MSKKKVIPVATIFFVMLIGVSCSKSGNEPGTDPGVAEASWKMGTYAYTRGGSNQNSSIIGGANFHVIVATTSGAPTQGVFSGSSVAVKFFDQGPGEYNLVTEAALVSANAANKIMSIDCTIGTGTSTGSTLYTYASGTAKAQVTKVNNQYRVTIDNGIVLNKKLDVNGGVAGALTSYSFTCKSVF
jgi:hypothetical protein